jgi:type IV pilus assembly protein PilB
MQHAGDTRRLGNILIDQEWITAESLALALSIHLNLPFADLSRQTVSLELTKIIPENVARRYQLIPVEISNGSLLVVMEDPTDIRVLSEISALTIGGPGSPRSRYAPRTGCSGPCFRHPYCSGS